MYYVMYVLLSYYYICFVVNTDDTNNLVGRKRSGHRVDRKRDLVLELYFKTTRGQY